MLRWARSGIAIAVALAGSARAGAQETQTRIRPDAWGTSQDSIYRISTVEFSARSAGTKWMEDAFPGTLARYSPNCLGFCFEADPHLPDGAMLTGIEAYFCNVDPDPQNAPAISVNNTLYDGTNITTLATVVSQSHNGCGESVFLDLSSLNYQVNYDNNQLLLIADIEDTDGSEAIAGVKLFYRLQVSPAPPTPDFGDVSTTNPQFPFVEALYNSGITVGCGGGNYCPNNPLTRGQMAVFLAKALGLQWQ